MADKTPKKSAKVVKKAAAERVGPKPILLAGGNPQIAKADGDAPVQAYIAAMPGWKRDVGRRLDALIVRTVPGVSKAVKWSSPFYGIEGQGWFFSSKLSSLQTTAPCLTTLAASRVWATMSRARQGGAPRKLPLWPWWNEAVPFGPSRPRLSCQEALVTRSQDRKAKTSTAKRGRLSLWPLSLDEALGGAMQRGKTPERENKRAKRTLMHRQLTKGDKQAGKAGQRDG